MTGTHGTNHDELRPRARRSRSRVGRFTPALAMLHLGALVGLLALFAFGRRRRFACPRGRRFPGSDRLAQRVHLPEGIERGRGTTFFVGSL